MEERALHVGLADLAIKVGVALRRGQQLVVIADVEHAPLARATMEAGWRAGARPDVLVYHREPYDRLFLGLHGSTDAQLQRSHPSQLALLDALEMERSAIVAIEGETEPDLYGPSRPKSSRGSSRGTTPPSQRNRRAAGGGVDAHTVPNGRVGDADVRRGRSRTSL